MTILEILKSRYPPKELSKILLDIVSKGNITLEDFIASDGVYSVLEAFSEVDNTFEEFNDVFDTLQNKIEEELIRLGAMDPPEYCSNHEFDEIFGQDY